MEALSLIKETTCIFKYKRFCWVYFINTEHSCHQTLIVANHIKRHHQCRRYLNNHLHCRDYASSKIAYVAYVMIIKSG